MTRLAPIPAVPAVLVALAAALPGCMRFQYDETPSPFAAPAREVDGVPIPRNVPARDAYTTYFEVREGENVLGYVVRYDEPPVALSAEKAASRLPTGSLWIEDAKFDRIGFVTSYGRAYRFDGKRTEELGEGTIEQLAPLYFGRSGLTILPLR